MELNYVPSLRMEQSPVQLPSGAQGFTSPSLLGADQDDSGAMHGHWVPLLEANKGYYTDKGCYVNGVSNKPRRWSSPARAT